MSTKYGVSPRARWSMDGNPRMSDHAADRWCQRTPSDSVSPEHAFENGIDASEVARLLNRSDGVTPDGLRYWHGQTDKGAYSSLFIVREGVITTVYDVSTLAHKNLKAYLMAYNEEFGEFE